MVGCEKASCIKSSFRTQMTQNTQINATVLNWNHFCTSLQTMGRE